MVEKFDRIPVGCKGRCLVQRITALLSPFLKRKRLEWMMLVKLEWKKSNMSKEITRLYLLN